LKNKNMLWDWEAIVNNHTTGIIYSVVLALLVDRVLAPAIPLPIAHKEVMGYPIWNYSICLVLQFALYPLLPLWAYLCTPSSSKSWFLMNWDEMTPEIAWLTSIFWYSLVFHMLKDSALILRDPPILIHHAACVFLIVPFGLGSTRFTGLITTVVALYEVGSGIFNVSTLRREHTFPYAASLVVIHLVGILLTYFIVWYGPFSTLERAIILAVVSGMTFMRHRDSQQKYHKQTKAQ
jgi:hypothetical protein